DVDVAGGQFRPAEAGLYLRDVDVIERDPLRTAAALDGVARPCPLHEDLSHRQCGDGEKVRAAVELARALAGEAQEGLVDEGSGLDGLARPLASHVSCGNAPQLVVDERHELGNGVVLQANSGAILPRGAAPGTFVRARHASPPTPSGS